MASHTPQAASTAAVIATPRPAPPHIRSAHGINTPRTAWPQKGAELRCHSADDGRELSKLELDSAPVFDGLIAAQDRLYLATLDGRLSCYGK